MKNFYKRILSLSEKKLIIIIWTISVLILVSGTILIRFVFVNEIIIYDPRYIQLAHNLYTKCSFEIKWGVSNQPDTIMVNPYNLQKGIYYNWFPIGYSLVIYFLMLLDKNYYTLLVLIQLLIFSTIPLIVFKIGLLIWHRNKFSYIYSLAAALLVILNPYFSISALYRTDTWFIIFLNALGIYYLLKLILYPKKSIALIFSFVVIIIFFFRPLITYCYFIFLILNLIFLTKVELKSKSKLFMYPITLIFLVLIHWGIKNYLMFNRFDFSNSSVGYNLWLGNNDFTNEYLKKYLGDGGVIEDYIIPKFEKKFEFLSSYSEYSKNDFFLKEAIKFIITNPLETIENSALKLFGFFSPLRVRYEHWSDSKLKNILTLIYQLPLNLLFILSTINLIKIKFKDKYLLKVLLLYLIIFILPYLIFFSLQRFKAPIDFILVIFVVDFLFHNVKILSKKF